MEPGNGGLSEGALLSRYGCQWHQERTIQRVRQAKKCVLVRLVPEDTDDEDEGSAIATYKDQRWTKRVVTDRRMYACLLLLLMKQEYIYLR